jgi:ABC-type Na+ efflux pump permease subunit
MFGHVQTVAQRRPFRIGGRAPACGWKPAADRWTSPDAIKQAFGITEASFASAEGYLAGELFNLVAPFACCYFVIHAIAGALGGADQRATLDVVLSVPMARRHHLAGWLAGIAVVLLGVLLVLAFAMQAAAGAAGTSTSCRRSTTTAARSRTASTPAPSSG